MKNINYMVEAIRQQIGFLVSFFKFIYFVRSLDNSTTQNCSEKCDHKISIVITPWMYTAVPWFAITVGIFLSKRVSVEYVFDDSDYDAFALNQRFASLIQKKLIGLALRISSIDYIKVSDSKSIDNEPISTDELAELNLLATK